MVYDPTKALEEVETVVATRNRGRQAMQLQFRSPAALEAIADELTRIRAYLGVIAGTALERKR
jgi:hypothetical protein